MIGPRTLRGERRRTARILTIGMSSALLVGAGFGSLVIGETKVLEPEPAPTVTIRPRPVHAELYKPEGDSIRVDCSYRHVICEGRERP